MTFIHVSTFVEFTTYKPSLTINQQNKPSRNLCNEWKPHKDIIKLTVIK